jgi:hypothetical protein
VAYIKLTRLFSCTSVYPHNRLLVEKNPPILFNAQKLSPQETEEYIENSNYFKSSDNHINYKKSF